MPDPKSTFYFEENSVATQRKSAGYIADPYREAVGRVRDRVGKKFTPQEIANGGPQVSEFVRQAANEVYLEWSNEAAQKGFPSIPTTLDLFVSKAESELLGMGELDPLLADPGIEDIAVNGPDEVYIFKGGQWQTVPITFAGSTRLLEILNRGIAGSNRQANQVSPIADATLPAGERISIVTFPVTNCWPVAVVRSQRVKTITIMDMARANPGMARLEQAALSEVIDSPLPDYTAENGPGAMLSSPAAAYLHAAVLAGLNIVVLGPTGVGKTTMLTALGRCLPVGDRILIVEDTPEIKLHPESDVPKNVIYLRTRPSSLEGVPPVTQEDLVRLALRQRPDALTLGEARGAEIFDLLNALITGHKNGLTSLHTFSASEMFDRVFLMLAQSERGRFLDIGRAAKLVASTLNVGITLERRGRIRRILAITEFTGNVTVEGGRPRPEQQEIFRHTGIGGRLDGPLTTSAFASRFAELGIPQKFYSPG